MEKGSLFAKTPNDVIFESEKCFGEPAKSPEYVSGIALISFPLMSFTIISVQAKID
jgi:hypothetical protein